MEGRNQTSCHLGKALCEVLGFYIVDDEFSSREIFPSWWWKFVVLSRYSADLRTSVSTARSNGETSLWIAMGVISTMFWELWKNLA
jgi:hypothetical protein